MQCTICGGIYPTTPEREGWATIRDHLWNVHRRTMEPQFTKAEAPA